MGEACGGLGAVAPGTAGTAMGGVWAGLGGGTAGFFLIIVPVGDMDPVELWELRRSPLPTDGVDEAAELRRRSIELVGLLFSSKAFFSTCLKKSKDEIVMIKNLYKYRVFFIDK